MEKEAKKMERPNWNDFLIKYEQDKINGVIGAHGVFNRKMEEYCDQLEKERDELKLKEDIAHTAKEVVQDAHQKSQKELQALKDAASDYIIWNELINKTPNQLQDKLKSLIK